MICKPFSNFIRSVRKSKADHMDVCHSNPESLHSPLPSGVSIRNGPISEVKKDIDIKGVSNNSTKRKSRGSIPKPVNLSDTADDDSDEIPLVCRK